MHYTLGVGAASHSQRPSQSAVNEIVAKLYEQKQQMRQTRTEGRCNLPRGTDCVVLNDTLEKTFRRRDFGFRPRTTTRPTAAA
jgi:hypothetical protein